MVTSAIIPALFITVSQFCHVPAKILYSVALVESRAHPYTLNIEGKGLFFDTRREQFDTLMIAISEGRSVDIGIMQLNWKWKRDYAASPWELTDETYNLTVACRIIKDHYQQHGDWFVATGYYHREAQRPKDFRARERYTNKVKQAWASL